MMDTIQLKPNEHLDVLLKNPTNALSYERALSGSTYTLLSSYFKAIRKLHGIRNPLDIKAQNQMILDEFMFLCDHNLLFLLTVTGRYDLIRKLFKSNQLTPRERHLIRLIQGKRSKANRHKGIVINKLHNTPVHTASDSEDWKKYAHGFTSMDFYYYYSKEIERVSCEYQSNQIELLTKAHQERQIRLFQAIEAINSNSSIDEAIKAKGQKLYEKYKAMPALPNMYQNKPSLDVHRLKNLEEQYLLIQKYYKESEEIHKFLLEASRYNPQIKALLIEEEQATTRIQKQLAINEQIFQKEMTVLQSHLEKVRKDALRQLDINFERILHCIADCPKNTIHPEEKRVLERLEKQLQKDKEALKKMQDFDAVQALLKSSLGKTRKISTLLQRHMTPSEWEILLREMALLKEGIIEDVAHSTYESSLVFESRESGIIVEQPKNTNQFKSKLHQIREERDSIIISEDDQERFRYQINAIKTIVSNIHSLTPEDKMGIIAAEEIIKKIKGLGFERASLSLLKSLCSQIENLTGKYGNLEESKMELSDFIAHLSNGLESGAHI